MSREPIVLLFDSALESRIRDAVRRKRAAEDGRKMHGNTDPAASPAQSAEIGGA